MPRRKNEAARSGTRPERLRHGLFDFSARRWGTHALDAARHPRELVAEDRIHLHLDLAHTGIGPASCGPGVLPGYRLEAGSHRLGLEFATVG